MLIKGTISAGHARTLLGLEDQDAQLEAAQKIIDESLSVRQTEDLVKQMNSPVVEKKIKVKIKNNVFYKDLEKNMTESLGTKVKIRQSEEGKGKIEISFYSPEELDRIFTLLNQQ